MIYLLITKNLNERNVKFKLLNKLEYIERRNEFCILQRIGKTYIHKKNLLQFSAQGK